MAVATESKSETEDDRRAVVARAVIRSRSVVRTIGAIIGRRRACIIARWRGSWCRYPIAAGTVLELAECVGLSRNGRGKKENHSGQQAKDKLLHRLL